MPRLRIYRAAYLLLALAALLASCGQVSETIYLDGDGGGRYELSYDASEMLAMIEMMAAMQEAEGDDEGQPDDGPAGSHDKEEVDPQAAAMELFERGRLDTVVSFRDILTQGGVDEASLRRDSLAAAITREQGSPARPGQLDSAETAIAALGAFDFAMEMDKEAGVLRAGMMVDFEELNGLAETFGSLASMGAIAGGSGGAAAAGGSPVSPQSSFRREGNVLVVTKDPAAALEQTRARLSERMGRELTDEEAREMMGMMGSSDYSVTVHVPGKITGVAGGNHLQLDDNTVVLTVPLAELMESGGRYEARVAFKPKRKLRRAVSDELLGLRALAEARKR